MNAENACTFTSLQNTVLFQKAPIVLCNIQKLCFNSCPPWYTIIIIQNIIIIHFIMHIFHQKLGAHATFNPVK